MDTYKDSTMFMLCVFLVLNVFVRLNNVEGVSISASKTGGILNNPLSVICSYSLEEGETFSFVTMSRLIGSDTKNLLKCDNNQAFFYGNNVDISDRSTISRNSTSCILNVNSTECGDEVTFECSLEYRIDVIQTSKATVAVQVDARPQKPSQLFTDPTGLTFPEFTQVGFECTSIVGKLTPIGSIKWEGVRESAVEDLTSGSEILKESTVTGSCETEVISRLTRNLTRRDNGLVIRCRTTHATLSSPDMYRDLDPLIVYYPVEDENLSVIQDPNLPTHTVGRTVTLRCSITSLPAAQYMWRHLESNTTFDSDDTLVLSNVQLEQSGTYSCEASNSFSGKNYTARGTINVNIQLEPTTTPAPPTKSSERTTNRPGVTDTSVSNAGMDETTIIIIVVVVAVIVALLIVAIVVFVIFRNRKKKESESIVDSGNAYNFNNNPKVTSPNKPDITNVDEKKSYYLDSPYQSNPYSNSNYHNHNNSFDMKSERSYSDLNFDDRPRSRRPLAMSDADYADISMPHV